VELFAARPFGPVFVLVFSLVEAAAFFCTTPALCDFVEDFAVLILVVELVDEVTAPADEVGLEGGLAVVVEAFLVVGRDKRSKSIFSPSSSSVSPNTG
jgi:hypothetical protein